MLLNRLKRFSKNLRKQQLKESTNEALNIMNESLSLVLSNCNLEKKPSREEKRQVKKQHFREAVEKIETDYGYTLQFMAVGIR